MFKGTILVDEKMATNVADVYAAGDCAMVKNRLTGERQWSPMGSSANMEGRTLALILGGREVSYPGVLGTGVVKLPGLSGGRTGLSEEQACAAGYQTICALAVTDDKAHYYPGSAWFAIKLVADAGTHKLLGVQVLGPGAVDKVTDIGVMAVTFGATWPMRRLFPRPSILLSRRYICCSIRYRETWTASPLPSTGKAPQKATVWWM